MSKMIVLDTIAKIADEVLFNSIKEKFPTIELAWTEIACLTKELLARG